MGGMGFGPLIWKKLEMGLYGLNLVKGAQNPLYTAHVEGDGERGSILEGADDLCFVSAIMGDHWAFRVRIRVFPFTEAKPMKDRVRPPARAYPFVLFICRPFVTHRLYYLPTFLRLI